MHSSYLTSQKWFSILVALGTIGILLIIATSLANIYINELKLSRLQYNSILAYGQADGVFEYAMLKIKNHREWFQDTMGEGDVDGYMLAWVTPRTSTIESNYQIVSQASSGTFSLSGSSHLIIPLFVGTGVPINGSMHSRDPREDMNIQRVRSLTLSSSMNLENISWSIVGMSGTGNIGIAGTGSIFPSTMGVIRLQWHECYDADWERWTCGDGIHGIEYGWDTLEYFYDSGSTIADFLANPNISDSYLLLFNGGASVDLTIQTDSPFTLPVMKVVTESKKWQSLQSIEFSEDKSKYYDAIRYGIYNQ